MKRFITKKIIDKIFESAILIKSVFGIFEILAGTVLATSGKLIEDNIIVSLARQEIIEDPNDFIANHLIDFFNGFLINSHVFATLYLIFHGVINIFLAIALSNKKTWAYHSALTGFGVFIIYQTFKYFHTFSPLLLSLTLLDILIVIAVLLEYKDRKKVKK
ncbi:MAG: DUF2127 domain-containing protein [Candidatus Staskawiczbacteria bacterium]